MNPSIRQLRVLTAIVDHGSITAAAKALFITQPAVSMQLAHLETQAGLPLLERVGRKVYLTEAGEVFYHSAREVLQTLENVSEAITQMRGMEGGRLTLAVAATANYFCSPLLAVFRQRIKDLSVRLYVTNRSGLLQHLHDNDVDMVIMGRPPEGLDVDARPFLDNPLVVIAPPDYPAPPGDQWPLDEMAKQGFVVREAESGTRQAMERFFQERSIPLNTSMEMRSNEAVQLAVQAGLGLGIVSRHTLDAELETRRLKILPVEGFPILRQWHLVCRTGKRLSPVALAFYQFIQDEAKELLSTH